MLFVRRSRGRGTGRDRGPWTRTSVPPPCRQSFSYSLAGPDYRMPRLTARPEDGDTPSLFCGWPRSQSSTAACGWAQEAVGNACTSIPAMRRRPPVCRSRLLGWIPQQGEEKEKHGGPKAATGQRLADRRCLDRSCSAAADGRTDGTGSVATDRTLRGPADTLESPAWWATGRSPLGMSADCPVMARTR